MTAQELRFAGYQSPASIHSQAAEAFCGELSDELGPRATVSFTRDVTEAGSAAADLPAMVEDGRLTFCYFSTSYLAARDPAFAVLDLPFAFARREEAYRLVDGPIGAALSTRLRAAGGLRVLDFWDNGFRHFTNRIKPIREPGDCAGLRIRTLGSEVHARVFSALGFEPVFLDVRELRAAVENNRVDAQENPLTNTFNFGIHRHHRHITLTGHFWGAAALLCNGASYDAWPEAFRAAVVAAARTATTRQRDLASAEDARVLARLDPTENEIVRLGAGELDAFREAVAAVTRDECAKLGSVLPNVVDALPGGLASRDVDADDADGQDG